MHISSVCIIVAIARSAKKIVPILEGRVPVRRWCKHSSFLGDGELQVLSQQYIWMKDGKTDPERHELPDISPEKGS